MPQVQNTIYVLPSHPTCFVFSPFLFHSTSLLAGGCLLLVEATGSAIQHTSSCRRFYEHTQRRCVGVPLGRSPRKD